MTRRLSFVILLLLVSCRPAETTQGPGNLSSIGEAGDDDRLWKGDEPALGDLTTMTQAFTAARQVLYGEPAGDTSLLDSLPGRRVFLCAYGVKRPNLCGTGVGGHLGKSVAAAARDLATRGAGRVTAEHKAKIKLKLDVVTRTRTVTFDRKIERPKKRNIAMYGYWVVNGEQASYILPSEVLEQGIYSDKKKKRGMARKKVVKTLKRRNPELGDLAEEFTYEQFRTIPWVERDQPGQDRPDITRLYRTHKYEWESIDPDNLLQFIVWAEDYLTSSVDDAGNVRYRYYVDRDKDSSSYNWLRHGGTTYSMLQVYDRTRFLPYLRAAEAAIKRMLEKCERQERSGHWGGGQTMFLVSPSSRKEYTPDGKRLKLGGTGLSLLALTTYAEVTGDTQRHGQQAREMGNFLIASQEESGKFQYFPPYREGGPLDPEDSLYYPGEAILGLAKLYSFTRDKRYLDAAVRAADWLIDVRDKGKTDKQLANDHWLMIALSFLYLQTEDPRYVKHSLALARSVENQYLKRVRDYEKGYRDFLGGYYDPPRSTPAATRGEGMVAVLDTCEMAGEQCGWIMDMLKDTVRHEMLSSYQPDLMFWVKNQSKTFGGWNGGLTDPSIRNDFVQHNMISLLGLERHLRKADGVVLPGGPEWTEKVARGEAAAAPVPPEQMAKLRAATLRYRGEDRWTRRVSKEQPAPDAAPPPAAP